MTLNMHVVRWVPALIPRCVQVLPSGRQAFLQRLEDVARHDRTAGVVAIYTPSVADAQTYSTREAAAHDAARLGLGEPLPLSAVLDGSCGQVLVPDESVAGEGL